MSPLISVLSTVHDLNWTDPKSQHGRHGLCSTHIVCLHVDFEMEGERARRRVGRIKLGVTLWKLPLVLWRCWLGGRKGIRPVKNWVVGAGVVICLERGADLHMAQLMPLPLTVSCSSKIQIGFTFLVPAYLGSPGKRGVKRACKRACDVVDNALSVKCSYQGTL